MAMDPRHCADCNGVCRAGFPPGARSRTRNAISNRDACQAPQPEDKGKSVRTAVNPCAVVSLGPPIGASRDTAQSADQWQEPRADNKLGTRAGRGTHTLLTEMCRLLRVFPKFSGRAAKGELSPEPLRPVRRPKMTRPRERVVSFFIRAVL